MSELCQGFGAHLGLNRLRIFKSGYIWFDTKIVFKQKIVSRRWIIRWCVHSAYGRWAIGCTYLQHINKIFSHDSFVKALPRENICVNLQMHWILNTSWFQWCRYTVLDLWENQRGSMYVWLILTIFSGGQYKLRGLRGTRVQELPPPPPDKSSTVSIGTPKTNIINQSFKRNIIEAEIFIKPINLREGRVNINKQCYL